MGGWVGGIPDLWMEPSSPGPGIGPIPVIDHTCHCLVAVSPGVWLCVLGWGGVGVGKEPRPPGWIPSPPTAHLASLRPPGSDHTGCLSLLPPSPDLRPAQGLQSAVVTAGRLCVRMCVYACAPVTRSVFLSVTECTVGHIYVSWAVCVGLGGAGGLERGCGPLCVPTCVSPLCSRVGLFV